MKIFFGIFLLVFSFSWSTPVFSLSESGYKSLHIFSKVLNQVEKNYVEEVNDVNLVRNAIKGLLTSLDHHTVYMPPSAYKELRVDTAGRFGGIGIEVWIRGGYLTVVAPIEGTTADKAGIKSGDNIIKVNGVSTSEMDIECDC